VLNSRFLACLDYVDSVAAAKEFVAGIRHRYPDASHHVPAYIVGGGASTTEFCSDDGEPSGTSGRPLLAVLRGSGLGNAAIVVTRWFGGTLLGTGGLVKAYSEAGRLVLEKVERARLVDLERLSLTLPYALYERLRSLLADLEGIILSEDFGEAVQLSFDLPLDRIESFGQRLADLGSGSLAPIKLGSHRGRLPMHSPGATPGRAGR
jgi:uncharacterized YigZ family protein